MNAANLGSYLLMFLIEWTRTGKSLRDSLIGATRLIKEASKRETCPVTYFGVSVVDGYKSEHPKVGWSSKPPPRQPLYRIHAPLHHEVTEEY